MHGSPETWQVALQSGEKRAGGGRGWKCCTDKLDLPASPADSDITYRCLDQELKGEVDSLANMWLHAAIPRPAPPPLHHLSARIIEQHIMCSHCAVLSCSSHRYHQQGQRFHCNVWRTRKSLDPLVRRSCDAQTELTTDVWTYHVHIKHSSILFYNLSTKWFKRRNIHLKLHHNTTAVQSRHQ